MKFLLLFLMTLSLNANYFMLEIKVIKKRTFVQCLTHDTMNTTLMHTIKDIYIGALAENNVSVENWELVEFNQGTFEAIVDTPTCIEVDDLIKQETEEIDEIDKPEEPEIIQA